MEMKLPKEDLQTIHAIYTLFKNQRSPAQEHDSAKQVQT